MLAASDKYPARATAVWQGSHLCLYQFGKNQHGHDVIGSTTETFGGSGGAHAICATASTSAAKFPIRSRAWPMSRATRRRCRSAICSGGGCRIPAAPASFRGGTGGEYAMVLHDAPEQRFGFVVSGKGVDYPMAHGVSGGYPGAPGRYVIVRDCDQSALHAPKHLDQIVGRQEPVSWGVYEVGPNDAFYVRWNGGGGYGDPLERDPAAVCKDVIEGTVSHEAARDLFGVIVKDDHLDTAQTDALRRTLRDRRIGRGAAA